MLVVLTQPTKVERMEIEAKGKTADKSKPGRVAKSTRQVFALLFWSFLVVKVFVYDFDIALFDNFFPYMSWILKYKFFIIIGGIAIFWLFVGNKFFWTSILYVIAYPTIILFWKIPKAMFKNWMVMVFLLPAIISFFRSARMNFVLLVFSLISGLLILLSAHPYLTIPSMCFLLCALVIHYSGRFSIAFSPASFFEKLNSVAATGWDKYRENTLLKDLRDMSQAEPNSKEYSKKRGSTISALVLVNRLMLYLSSRLQRAQKSQIIIVYFILALAYTFLLTVVVFGFEYFGLYHLDSNSFSGKGESSIWFFVYYSFNTFVKSNTGDFTSAGIFSRLFTVLEHLGSILIGVILIFAFMTILRERYHKELDVIVHKLQREGKQLEKIAADELQITWEEVQQEYVNSSSGNKKFFETLDPNK